MSPIFELGSRDVIPCNTENALLWDLEPLCSRGTTGNPRASEWDSPPRALDYKALNDEVIHS